MSKTLSNQMCSNELYKKNSLVQVLLSFLPSMLKSFLIFKRNGAHLVEKKMIETKKLGIVHFRGLSALNMQKHFLFVSSFKHVSFIVNETYSKKILQSKPLCFLYMIFETYKNVVLNNVHSLGWLL
jgi:hypothetical protein